MHRTVDDSDFGPMTGPEHYTQAETLLGMSTQTGVNDTLANYYVAAAQVHATLALAAASGPPAPRETRHRIYIEEGNAIISVNGGQRQVVSAGDSVTLSDTYPGGGA